MASMGISINVSKKDGSFHDVTPPAPPPSPSYAEPPVITTREMDIDDYITFYTYGSENLASRGVQSSANKTNLRQDSLKQISDIIQSKEVNSELSEKGEIISNLFEKQLLSKLDASGLISEDAANTAKTTSIKFAKWMEEIVSECERRKRARNSMGNQPAMQTPKQDDTTAIGTETELVRINEISDEDIEKRFGLYLRDSSKHVLFHFESPNRQPRIVIHLLPDSNVKMMIVREMASDLHWSNWLIEIGSDDSGVMDNNLSSSKGKKHVSDPRFVRLEDKFENCIEETKFYNGKSEKHSKFDWDANKMADIFGKRNYYTKMPILKRQCVSTLSDCEVEYPVCLSKFSGSIADKLFDFEGPEVVFPIPPQHHHTET
ncbi:uncharacterized protein LOC111046897 isoform X3 [Nilaparvata lugens]|nr:uncharacterized protein LOC111046897 isoform X3 [Nilaparvata lugens]